MKIAVGCKFTPDTEDIIVTPDGEINLTKAVWNISEYDLQAVEAAGDLAGETGGEAVALTVGPEIVKKTKFSKDLLSRGDLLSLYRVADDACYDSDVNTLAKILAAMVRRVGADVILFGEGSSDRYYRQTGMQTAAILGYAGVSCVNKITVDGEALIVERILEDEIEEVRVPLPCVLSVTSTINSPKVPGMKAILAAGKKPVIDLELADLGFAALPPAAVDRISQHAPPEPARLKIILAGTAQETAAQLVVHLKNDGVL
jgi:electron transfer flavoprotein beta subunit